MVSLHILCLKSVRVGAKEQGRNMEGAGQTQPRSDVLK